MVVALVAGQAIPGQAIPGPLAPGELSTGERPGDLGKAFVTAYRRENLSRYRYHTGATLRPIAADETCPILFRDLGLAGTALFLNGELRRLAGPPSPITYMRTWHHVEPYTDHGRIGRLVFLRPLTLHPWHSGVRHIYVASGARLGDSDTIGYVPGHIDLQDAATRLAHARTVSEVREVFGPEYDDARHDAVTRITALQHEERHTEAVFEPLRRRLQSRDRDARARARDDMARWKLDESDLCTAWHHLGDDRRAYLRALADEQRPGAGESPCPSR